jgi:hypothetical protein
MYRTDCGTAHPVLLNPLSNVNTSCGVGSWSRWSIAYIYVWLESSYDPPEGHPGQLAYTFLICILSTSFILVSIFSVCCYSRVSMSVVHSKSTYMYFQVVHCTSQSTHGVAIANFVHPILQPCPETGFLHSRSCVVKTSFGHTFHPLSKTKETVL